MPAYARDGKVVCFFQGREKFKTRYATFGFMHKANLDEGNRWPVAFALKKMTAAKRGKDRCAREESDELRRLNRHTGSEADVIPGRSDIFLNHIFSRNRLSADTAWRLLLNRNHNGHRQRQRYDDSSGSITGAKGSSCKKIFRSIKKQQKAKEKTSSMPYQSTLFVDSWKMSRSCTRCRI